MAVAACELVAGEETTGGAAAALGAAAAAAAMAWIGNLTDSGSGLLGSAGDTPTAMSAMLTWGMVKSCMSTYSDSMDLLCHLSRSWLAGRPLPLPFLSWRSSRKRMEKGMGP